MVLRYRYLVRNLSPKVLRIAYGSTVANNFWGRDDAGLHPLLDRMQNAKTTCDELKGFYAGTSGC